MNNWSGVGRLTKDPEIRYGAESQTAVANFTVAIDDGYGEKKSTDFIKVVAFGKTAENVERFLAKGKLVGVVGRIKTGSYKNKEGATVYTTEVYANNVEFLSPKDESAPAPRNDVPEGFMAVDDEDCPF